MLISAIVSAPWPRHFELQIALGVCAVVGFVWSLLVLFNIRKIKFYSMVLEDWAWHIALPLLAYVAAMAGVIVLESHTVLALFLIGGTATMLVLIGIHNAWDTVTHLTLQRLKREQEKTGE